ncbi:MAG: phage tail protein I [Faecalibacterium sp.]
MIKFSDIQPSDLLPEGLRDDVEAMAIAYAVCRQIEKWCAYNDSIRIYYMISSAPDNILDLLAAEYKTPAYSPKYSIEVKRALIADTMLYFMKLGTPQAVRRIVTSIFQSGTVSEWFDYGGEPHHFRINISNPNIGPDDLNEFVVQLQNVKRLSSWLDSISSEIDIKAASLYVAQWMHTGDFVRFSPMVIEDITQRVTTNETVGIGVTALNCVTIVSE